VRWITADVFDGLATLEDRSVDLVVTSPPFLALRSYLPADHPDKDKEIGSETTPAEFIDTLLAVTAELRRVLAPHGSIAIELGDTYAGSGGGGGDYYEGGLREGQPGFTGSADADREALKAANAAHWRQKNQPRVRQRKDGGQYGNWPQGGTKHNLDERPISGGTGWPLAKSKTLIPELFRIALAYGHNPLTGAESPAGKWRVRNVVTWCRPNPPVGALGDKWRPATSDVVVACVSGKRYWDDLATRKPGTDPTKVQANNRRQPERFGERETNDFIVQNPSGAPLLDYWQPPLDMTIREAIETGWLDPGDYWEIPPGGYKGSHYAVFPPELVVPLVKAMCPEKVCRTCGEPSRRITETTNAVGMAVGRKSWLTEAGTDGIGSGHSGEITVEANDRSVPDNAEKVTLGWTDCGHDNYRPGLVLDCFAGSGTTLAVAQGHGHDAIGIDLDSRNAELARGRLGMFFEVDV